jgi:hypothetical protein
MGGRDQTVVFRWLFGVSVCGRGFQDLLKVRVSRYSVHCAVQSGISLAELRAGFGIIKVRFGP